MTRITRIEPQKWMAPSACNPCNSRLKTPQQESHPQHLHFDRPLAWSIQFRQNHTLELPQNHLPINKRQHDTVTEKQAAQMRRRVASIAIGPFRRIVPVRNSLFNDALQKVVYIK